MQLHHALIGQRNYFLGLVKEVSGLGQRGNHHRAQHLQGHVPDEEHDHRTQHYGDYGNGVFPLDDPSSPSATLVYFYRGPSALGQFKGLGSWKYSRIS